MTIHEVSSGELIVDGHQHFWDPDRIRYEWMPPSPNVLHKSYLPDDIAPILERNGISQTVLVQAHHSMDETDFLLELTATNDFVAGVVVWVDLTRPDVGAVLDDLCHNSKVVGIRHQTELEPDEAWLNRPAVIRGLKEVYKHDLTYDLLVKTRHHECPV